MGVGRGGEGRTGQGSGEGKRRKGRRVRRGGERKGVGRREEGRREGGKEKMKIAGFTQIFPKETCRFKTVIEKGAEQGGRIYTFHYQWHFLIHLKYSVHTSSRHMLLRDSLTERLSG